MYNQSTDTIRVFYCYAREDDALRKQLATHLSPLRRLRGITWFDGDVQAGKEWERERREQLNTANIILLLISADFIASDYCYTVEMKHALDRHEAGTAHVIPILLRPVDWADTPFGMLSPLPKNRVPVTQWPDAEAAFLDIEQGINDVVKPLSKKDLSRANAAILDPIRNKPRVTTLPRWAIMTIIFVTIILVAVLGTFGVLFHPSLSQPKISVTSAYNAQGLPVGADGTTFHVSGQHFAGNSAITFLLDSSPLKEAQQTQSDGNGNVTVDLAVTSAWSVGQHILVAHDAGNTSTTSGIQIDVVQPGESNTPGPNGAPADDASFTLQTNRQATNANGTFFSTYTLKITGHPGPAGGSVCASRDTGTPVLEHGPSNAGVTDSSTRTYLCSGTYKGGKFSYFEALQASTEYNSSGVTCTLNAPVQSFQYITGSYTDQHNFSGNFTVSSIDRSMFTCTPADYSTWVPGGLGTWTGTVSQS